MRHLHSLSILVDMLMLMLVLSVPHALAATKVLVFVSPVSFDTGTDTIIVRLVVDIGDGKPLATNRPVTASAISNPATVIPSIKNLVITFMANQHSITVVANEILVFGAPQ